MRYVLALGWLSVTTMVMAASLTLTASDTVTVMPDGPRKGDKSKLYLNVQGADSERFASYGVLDFDPSNIQLPPGDLKFSEITLKLKHAPSKFSRDGYFKVWLAADASVQLEGGLQQVAFDSSTSPAGVGRTFGAIRPLGRSMLYQKQGSFGHEHEFVLKPSESMLDALERSIRDRTVIRLILTPVEPSVAATFTGVEWTGRDNTSQGAPELMLHLNES